MEKLINGVRMREHRVDVAMTWDEKKHESIINRFQKFLDKNKCVEDFDLLLNGSHLHVRTTDVTLALKAYTFASKLMDSKGKEVVSAEIKTY